MARSLSSLGSYDSKDALSRALALGPPDAPKTGQGVLDMISSRGAYGSCNGSLGLSSSMVSALRANANPAADSGYSSVLLEAYSNLPPASRAALPSHVLNLVIGAYSNQTRGHGGGGFDMPSM